MFALAWRMISALVAFLSNIVFPLAQREQFTVQGRTHLFWDTFARYDSGWYFGIARNGYQYVEGGRNNLAFFPVYPKLMGYLGYAMGGGVANYYYAGILISWSAFIAAMIVLYRLARLDGGEERAERAVVYAAVFPFAFFFGAVYSESLFLLAVVLAFYGFRTKRWGLGGLAGAVATATRVNGILVLPAFAWIVYREAGRDRARLVSASLALLLASSGFLLYAAYVYALTGSPLEWMHSIERWGVRPGGVPGAQLVGLAGRLATQPFEYLTTDRLAPYDTLNGLTAIACVLLTPIVWWRLGAAYGLFMLANLWLPLSTGWYEGLGRYCSVLFPVAILLAGAGSRVLHALILATSGGLYVLCLALFTNLHPLF